MDSGVESNEGASLEAAALHIIPVETTRQPPEPANAAFECRLGAPERNPFRGWNPQPHSIRNFQMQDVVLDGRFRGLFSSAGFIRGTSYLIPDEQMMTVNVDQACLTKVPDDTTVIIGCNVASDNYFNWVTQALPAIHFAVGRPGQDLRARLALPVLTSWQEESLDLLGHSGVRRVTIDDATRQYLFNRVEYSELLRGEATFRLSDTMSRTYSRLRAAVEYAPQDGRKLYVARTDTQTRRMRNENAVIAEVSKRGFEVVTPGALSFSEQIRLFRSASLVVGPHGAGMTNIVFCEPGTIVYELLPAHYTNPCYCNLAHVCGLRYWADAFASDGDGVLGLREWESDTALMMERLTEIEAIHAELREAAQRQTISAMDFLRGRLGQVSDLRVVQQSPEPELVPGLLGRLRQSLFGRSQV